ncbi:unnamed protein product [Acanthoscelides obtectus]|uniref:Uncharacterized protein n=1 Tax=Acanthoscelides obtectus TaxID=200917 RepID=A0A9P0MKC6_ACAOB|nr:unnamed protein product [Acanthoscelides obtectus]CAK1659716.1 Rabankyrin-5 [Acanthoscelides obtectus]
MQHFPLETDFHIVKRTALHVAAEAGNVPAVTALLENHADCDAVDVNQDNALHIAVREGSISVVRALLTQSTIDAEAVNLKGRNPLHELCKYGKENAAAICELFLECMPDYPINKLDVNGNSALLLAYMNGNGNLCRVLVKANASSEPPPGPVEPTGALDPHRWMSGVRQGLFDHSAHSPLQALRPRFVFALLSNGSAHRKVRRT